MTIAANDITARADAAATGLSGAAGATTQSCPKVTLEIGVFFDGTLNNAVNAGQGSEGSFANARSNVALLSTLYKTNSRHWIRNSCGGYATKYRMLYMPGIGTTDGQGDTTFPGAAMGMGSTGVEAIVYRACLAVGAAITELSPGIEPEEIVMDVFGFSRGAAAARYFVNCFRQGYVEYWKNYASLQRASVPKGRKVRFRFVGVFDTVAAIGLGTNERNGPVNVHMSTAQASRIHHLTAMNEYRENFRLNHTQPGGGTTQALPGAHSDVGGGYRNPGDEVLLERGRTSPLYGLRELADRHHQQMTDAMRRRNSATRARDEAVWISEGWLNPNETEGGVIQDPGPVRTRTQRLPGGIQQKVYSFEYGKRLSRPWVQIGLSRIPLRIMYDKALAQGAPLLSFPGGGEFAIPSGLAAVSGKLIAGQSLNQAETRHTLRNFGHVSANAGTIGMSAESNHVRVVYPNQPGQAK
ncbi:T6SS phospholipase effector Tle1-like catalytic domain-containing protein [Paracoccus sulfuroxidans]|uniref:Putative alpha/beta hydrolase family protein DUF2235 n=1 Tax=Paracoccus sulfuroxidans TaxID=384678 RepID=A0A562NV48_9RHOB|nr:DUF2235 domain-containing protein [Paracoccus sulfuroxidans]TWI36039.1 putative alpha/beta hydrolase family protein DUF2235 [Paracoccus sulfuroxidans]